MWHNFYMVRENMYVRTLKMFWRKSFTHDQKVWSIGHILDDKIKLWPITQLMKKKTVLLVFSVLDHYLIALFWFLIATLYNTNCMVLLKRSKGKLIWVAITSAIFLIRHLVCMHHKQTVNTALKNKNGYVYVTTS